MDAPILLDDDDRVAALHALALLDTPPEERFDRLTRLAQALLDVPIALVTLVDADRQWFKSRQGLAVASTPRAVSFCGHAIAGPTLFEVPDALADPRFAQNPLVTGEPHIRFYAGEPLVTADGHRVGTLCVIDRRPRTLDARERAALKDLAAIATAELGQVALAEALHQAEQAGRAKSDFLATMSHELRTPLNAIIGYSELMLEDAETLDVPGFCEDLTRIRHAGHHLLRTTSQILDLARLEAGTLELHPAHLPLAGFVQALATAVAPLAQAAGNQFDSYVAPDLPALHADPTLLRQTLMALLNNACRFTHQGKVVFAAQREGAQVVFTISDTGVGIRAEQLEALFEPFAQADTSTTREAGGTGLGLTLARRFARLMGGEVTAVSAPGCGSIFTVRLPILQPVFGAGPATAGPEPDASAPAEAPRRVVLAIDDDPVVRDLLIRQLRRECFEVVTAASGSEGLALARALRPTVITLDVMMPGMDGWAVLAALKADPALAGIPVIMLTMVEGRTASAALGAADYVPKPFDRAALAAAIARAVA